MSTYKLFYLAVALGMNLLSSSKVIAQNQLTGRILEKPGQGAPFATVMVLAAKDSSIVKAKITGEDGTYLIDGISNGQYYVAATYVGYKKSFSPLLTLNESALAPIDIPLVPDTQTLAEVTIKTQQAFVQKKADKLIVNIENSIAGKSTNAIEVLKVAPYVFVDGNNTVSLRGRTNVLILVDGKTIPEATLTTTLQSLAADNIASVEVITNPSAKYDASASGGVINIVTKQGQKLGLNGSYRVNTSQGQRFRGGTGLNLNYRQNKWNLYTDIDYSTYNGARWEQATRRFNENKLEYRSQSQTDQQTFPRLATKVGVDFSPTVNHVIGLRFDALKGSINNKLLNNAQFGRLNSPVVDSSLLTTGRMGENYTIFNYNFSYKGKLGVDKELSATATLTDYNDFWSQPIAIERHVGDDPSFISQLVITNKSAIQIGIAQLDYSLPIGKKAKAEIGVKYSSVRTNNNLIRQDQQASGESVVNPNFSNQSAYREEVAAAYLTINRSFKKLQFQGGLRAENTDASVINVFRTRYFNLFPSIFLQRKFGKNHDFSFSYTRRIDRQMYENMLPFIVFIDPYTQSVGNPNLKPQFASLFELSDSYKGLTFSAGYYHILNSMITLPEQDPTTKVTRFAVRNFSEMNNFYASINWPLTLAKWWQTTNSIWTSNNNLQSANFADFKTSVTTYSLQSVNSFSLPKTWQAQLTAYYTSRSIWGLNDTQPIYNVSFSISKELWKGKASLRLSADDMFWSERYRTTVRYGVVDQQTYNYYDTRRFGMSLYYKFGKKTVTPARSQNLNNSAERDRLKM
ncbi:outer membrane beta-barrel protein [Spirosoma sp.]|uniref:outer membrane beta-barrel protein n=1 Tax=Spirosoma sp. TaxID=1899569 RepID=UPI00261AE965|nr:outer membrane beta-barrel protein [Spirosoma sp.]MCX6212988.1 outer membrane beta-barrel protein [Spirosoma sp.]